MALRPKLTTADDIAARASQPAEAPHAKPAAGQERSEEEKAARKERVAKVKDALERSKGLKGEWVTPARKALKDFLRNLNNPKQPKDEQFEALLEAPFRQPPKKKTGGFGGGGFGGGGFGGRGSGGGRS